ncbi:MAG: dienelactone hydrolase family protein [Bacteroidetes bacterium]|nr:dienelactone hydrolase family protein [Bacteroidota bacterium]MCW5894928.1 dienelactone hydrolase family protein [Bacteroidota bacterium]
MKKVLKLLVVGILVLSSGIAYLYLKDYADYFVEQRGTFAHATSIPAEGDSVSDKSWLKIANADGLIVECGLLVPREKGKRYPAIILLGGKATGKHAVDYALDINDVIIAAPDYRYEPREKYTVTEFVTDVPAIRRALLDMIPSVMLLTDYLFTRSDVDTSKLVIVGYSFGAPFVPCILAHDRRAAAVAMVYGGGDLRTLIRHNVRRYEGALMSEFVGSLGGLLLRPIEPMRYVERISPVTLLMINGTDDEQIPRENVELLYAAAYEPKNIIWIESRHVHPRNPELTARIVGLLRKELESRGILVDE